MEVKSPKRAACVLDGLVTNSPVVCLTPVPKIFFKLIR